MKVYSIEYKLVTSIYGIEYKVVTSNILHLEYEWSTIVVLQSRHTRGGGINIIYSIASIMVYQGARITSKERQSVQKSNGVALVNVEARILSKD